VIIFNTCPWAESQDHQQDKRHTFYLGERCSRRQQSSNCNVSVVASHGRNELSECVSLMPTVYSSALAPLPSALLRVFTLVTKSCDQGNLYIVIGGEELAGPISLYIKYRISNSCTWGFDNTLTTTVIWECPPRLILRTYAGSSVQGTVKNIVAVSTMHLANA
jgi:hypothetical protein